MVRILVASLLLQSVPAFADEAPAAVSAPAAVTTSPGEIAAQVDRLHSKRDEEKVVAELDKLLKEGITANPTSYDLLWRMARLRHWQADGLSGDKQKNFGKEGWDYGERAMKANPAGPEGHYYCGIALGAYSTGAGIMKALSEGLEGKFNERIDKAMKLAPELDRGGPLVAKGRYHYELPWPKRSLEKSSELLAKVIKSHPENLRAYLYLAETQLKDGDAKKAKETIANALNGSTAYDPPEAKRIQGKAKKVQALIEEELN